MGKETLDVIVIGGGAAGMMAAGRAGESGAKVLLLEKKDGLGLKLLISGKGRCNLTNTGDIDHFLENFSRSGQFLRNAFHRFFNQDLMDFFEDRGLKLKAERGGRIFPVTDKARSVVDVLKGYMDKNRVEVSYCKQVEDVMVKDKEVCGVKCKGGEILEAKKVILSTGGLSYPLTGSTGEGYRIAKKAGHMIIPLRAALVPLETKEPWSRRLPGVSLENVHICIPGGTGLFGDMLFTHTGISGPIVLSLSAGVIDLLEKKKEVVVSVDLKPALSLEQLENRFLRETKAQGTKIFKNLLKGYLPKRLIPVFIDLLSINPEKMVHQITAEERKRLGHLLKDLRLTVIRSRPVEEAMVTRGGVDTREINPLTMESKIVKGLFFAGEVIDIDAKTGGYNLQAAFSTGRIAGENWR